MEKIEFQTHSGRVIAEITAAHPTIRSVEDVMDFWGDVLYNGSVGVIIPKSVLSDDFFELKTGLAGEILQKFTNYQLKLAISVRWRARACVISFGRATSESRSIS